MVEPLIALVALSLMEIVLGIDNIVFISVATSKLPAELQSKGRRLGLLLALGTRLLLLLLIFWIANLVYPLFTLNKIVPQVDYLKSYFYQETETDRVGHAFELPAIRKHDHLDLSGEPEWPEPAFDQEAWDHFNDVSIRDLILIAGGLFLIYSSVREIHQEVEFGHSDAGLLDAKRRASFGGVLARVAVMDVIFSLDSVITAVGMANQLWVMVAAVILAVGVMIRFADQVGNFVDGNPTIKMLAIAFLLLIGVMLCAEGIGTPISKGYIYFAMCFSLIVEFFNLRVRKRNDDGKTIQNPALASAVTDRSGD